MKKKLIGTGIGLSLFAGIFGANTVPVDMQYVMGGQFSAIDPAIMGTTTLPYAFQDDDANGIVSYELYLDSKGNRVFKQITDKLWSDISYTNRGDLLVPKNTELVTLGSVLLGAVTPKAHAAIAFDQASHGARISNTAISWSCTFAGSNIVGLMLVGDNNTTNLNEWKTITINAIGTTSNSFIDRSQLPSGGQGNMALYAFFAPTTGTCSATIGGVTNHVLDGHIASYTGVIQTGNWNLDPNSVLAAYQNATTSTAGTTFTLTTNPCAANSWLFMASQNDTAGANTAAGTNYTTRISDNAGAVAIGDTNGIVSGSTVMSTTTTATSNWEGIQVSIAPTGSTCGGAAAGSTNNDDGGWFEVL